MSTDRAAPAVRRPEQIPASPLGPGVTATELLDDRHGCRGLHQRRLRFAGGAGFAGTAGGQGEAWYVISGSGRLDAERPGRVALEPGTAVWLEPALGYACQAQAGQDLEILSVTVRAESGATGAGGLRVLRVLGRGLRGRPGAWCGWRTASRSVPVTGNSGCC